MKLYYYLYETTCDTVLFKLTDSFMSETSDHRLNEWVTDSFTHAICSKKLNHPTAKQHSVLLEDAIFLLCLEL